MGISDFYEVIKSAAGSNILVTVKLSELSGQKVAVDISIFLNKFVKTCGGERWIDNFIYLLCALKRNGIKPVCIFDGPNPPIEKKREQERRRAEGAKIQQRINEGKKLIKKLEKMALEGEELDEETISDVKIVIGVRRGRNVDAINYDDIYDVLSGLKSCITKKEVQNLPIIPEYSKKAKEIIEIMGFCHFQAEGEAECLCASMCCLGLVDGVLSEDTDVMAYGTPFLLSKLDLKTETIVLVSHEAILEGMEMEHEEFLDLCILLSCDYNERVKGYPPDGKKYKKPTPIGAKKALCMIQEYRRLEYVEEHLEDSDPLNYRRCRELFTPLEELPNITIPYNKEIDEDTLEHFLKTNRIRIKIDYILDTWKPVEMNFISEMDDVDDDNEIDNVEGENEFPFTGVEELHELLEELSDNE